MKVDCIIPLFNKKNYILSALQSALKQEKYKFSKIIVINDGSTDGGDLILEQFVKKFKTVKVISQKNRGSSVARNEGIKLSSADYIVFLDADDQLHSKYLLCLNLMINKHPDSKVFSTKHFNIYKNHELIKNSENIRLFKSKIIKLNNPILSYSFNPKIFCSSGICIEKNLISKIRFPEGINVGEDIYTWLKIFETNQLIYYDKELVIIFKYSENRSIDTFKEIPFYLKKINEFNIFKKKSYLIYFIISSVIYLYQKKNNNIIHDYFELIKKQSKLIFYLLKFFNNGILFKFYQLFKIKKQNEETDRTSLGTENFFLLAFNYFLVLPGIPLIVLFLYYMKKYTLIADVLLMSSITIFITSSISFYARPFALISNKFKDALKILKIKKLLIYPFLIILPSIYFIFSFDLIVINISVFFLLYLWRNESDLAVLEFIGSKNKLIKSLIETISLTVLMILNILFYNNLFHLFTLMTLLGFLGLKYRKDFKFNKLLKSIIALVLMSKNLIFVSLNSFMLNLTNFIHRFLILFYLEKTYAGILFFAYSMGSFPANLFSFVFSSTIIRNKQKISFFGSFWFISYFLFASYLFILDIFEVQKSLIFKFFDKGHLEYVYFSMVGGLLMSFALYKKNQIFYSKNSIQKLLIPEIIYSLVILSFIPFFYYFLDLENFKFIFLLNSLCAVIIFVPLKKIIENE